MAQYYYTDGTERYGPFTIEQLQERNITGETLVWKEGMADWLPAKDVLELESLLSSGGPSITPGIPSFASNTTTPNLPPKNWLVESILVTILCCLPLGIIGIINATKVESLWNAGQRDAALKASQEAGKWVKIAFFTGIVVLGLYFLLMVFGVIAGIGSGLAQ
ncbi:MAG TPA: CD225/dispanin family protein [Saprospiraceae bacterium]|nr:CD225/dispanin family protein [Saprospiraceae bacterium]